MLCYDSESVTFQPTVTRLRGKPVSKPTPINEEDLSDLSDGEGYFYPDDDELKANMEFMRLATTKVKRIKELYSDANKVCFCGNKYC